MPDFQSFEAGALLANLDDLDEVQW